MSSILDLIKGKDYAITEHLILKNPTLNEISENDEDIYYNAMNLICSTPSDYLVYLNDELGIDWERISEYEWFMSAFKCVPKSGLDLIFKDFNLDNLNWAIEDETEEICLIDENGNKIITPKIYKDLVELLRELNGFQKNTRISGNQSAHNAIIRSERKKIKRQKIINSKHHQKSILYSTVSTLVNLEGFKYNYSTVWDLHIYQFTDALKRTQKIKYYNQLMAGVYAGTVDTSKIDKNDLLLFEGL